MAGRFNVTAAAFGACALALAAFAADTLYTVRKGDTLSGIAGRHGITAKELAAANALKDADALDIGQKLRIPGAEPAAPAATPAPAAGANHTHVVKSGETLSDIAKGAGVATDQLAAANRITDPRALQAGQTLVLPAAPAGTPGAPARSAAAYPLPSSLRKVLDAQKVVPGKWRYIVVHHSATSMGSARGMELYHRNIRHMENGLAYHFVIGNGNGQGDGEITIGSRWRRQIKGGHLFSDRLNEISIGICLVGNFEMNRPTKKQLASLYALVNYLQDRCRTPADAVKTHRQINPRPTSCPGRYFPTQSLLANT